MYNAALKFDLPNLTDKEDSKIVIPYNPPPLENPPKFNFFSNKKLDDLQRLENTIHYWLSLQNINKNIKMQIFFDLLKNLNHTFRNKKNKFLVSKYKRKAPNAAITPSPKKTKTGWSDLLDTSESKKKTKIK